MGIKKFVSMQDINRVFDDVAAVDYITVDEVTDSMVRIRLHLTSCILPKPGSIAWADYADRCFVLGKFLDRKVEFTLVKSAYTKKVFRLFKPPLRPV